MACKFCGSKEIKVDTGYVETIDSDGNFGPVYKFCCLAQKTNAEYIKKNFHPDDAPDPDEVSRW